MQDPIINSQTDGAARRRWVLGAVAALLVVVAGLWFRASPSPDPQSPGEQAELGASKEPASEALIEVEPEMQKIAGLVVETVGTQELAEVIQTTAVVGPDETRVARVRPLADGRVLQVNVRVGDRVANGQPLLTYDSITAGELLADYRSALASLKRAEAEAEAQRRSVERADKLVELGGVARGERERRGAELESNVAGVNSARAAVSNLEQKLRRLGVSQEALSAAQAGGELSGVTRGAVTAPLGGVVLQLQAAPGEIIAPDRELFVIADLSRVWLQGDVYQKDIAKIRVGQNAIVTVDTYPGESFSGRVTHVSDVMDPATRTAKVRCEVVNRDGRLKVQMFATLALPTSAPRTVVVVPSDAVQDIDGTPTVFVRVDEEHFSPRPIKTGATVGRWTEVSEGIQVGDRVVTRGALMLKSRLKLRVEEEEGEGK
jgi:cobalt-zinc-cadmium efflux system membrane fusion protein